MDKKKIVRLYLAGKPVRQIAKEFGYSRERIYQILREEPLYEFYKKTHFCMKRKREVEVILKAKTRKEIMQELGISRSGLTILLKKLAKHGCIDEKVRLEFSIEGKSFLSEKIRKLLAKGLRNKEVAELLGVSEKFVATVKWRMLKNKILKNKK